MNLEKKNMKKILFLIVFTILFGAFVLNFQKVRSAFFMWMGVLNPLLIGCLIAFILKIPMNFFEKKLKKVFKKEGSHLPRALALIISLVLMIGLLTILLFYVIPTISTSVSSIINQVSKGLPSQMEQIQELAIKNEQLKEIILEIQTNMEEVIKNIASYLQENISSIMSSTLSVAGAAVSTIINALMGLLFACYIVLGKERLCAQFKRLIHCFLPEKREEQLYDVLALTNRTFTSFLKVQCLEACILGSMFVVTMLIIQYPYPVLIGVIIAFTALIPVVGAFIGCAISVLLLLTVDPIKGLVFIGIFLILQQIEGNLIYPKVVGSSIGLPPIWVFVAVVIGGHWGILGMLIFIPLSSVLYELLKRWTAARSMELAGLRNKASAQMEDKQETDAGKPSGKMTKIKKMQ